MFPQAIIHLVSQSADTEQTLLLKFKSRVHRAGFNRTHLKTVHDSENDPFLLVLLADQELRHGRDEQARHLIDAAYNSYDQNASSRIFKLHLAS